MFNMWKSFVHEANLSNIFLDSSVIPNSIRSEDNTEPKFFLIIGSQEDRSCPRRAYLRWLEKAQVALHNHGEDESLFLLKFLFLFILRFSESYAKELAPREDYESRDKQNLRV
jgi:hypothetical protein